MASALAMVHFHFPGLVDVSKVVEGFPRNTKDSDMVFLMPLLEEPTDAMLEIAPLEEILCGPSWTVKGDDHMRFHPYSNERKEINQCVFYDRTARSYPQNNLMFCKY